MTTAIISYDQQERMALSLVKSKMFGIDNVDQAMALMSIAVAEGKHPAIIARDFHLIQGRPAKKAEAMMRDLVQAGGSVKWHALDDTIADATFSHPQGGSVRITWDMARAKQAGLLGRGDMYHKYPRAMLRSRCVSEGVRTVCPLATSGVYTPEEVQDMIIDERPVSVAAINVTPVPPPSAIEDFEREDLLTAIRESPDLDALKNIYRTAYSLAKQAGNATDMEAFETAKKMRKAQLEAEEQP